MIDICIQRKRWTNFTKLDIGCWVFSQNKIWVHVLLQQFKTCIPTYSWCWRKLVKILVGGGDRQPSSVTCRQSHPKQSHRLPLRLQSQSQTIPIPNDPISNNPNPNPSTSHYDCNWTSSKTIKDWQLSPISPLSSGKLFLRLRILGSFFLFFFRR